MSGIVLRSMLSSVIVSMFGVLGMESAAGGGVVGAAEGVVDAWRMDATAGMASGAILCHRCVCNNEVEESTRFGGVRILREADESYEVAVSGRLAFAKSFAYMAAL